jgi:uncharacterized protein YecT (DUF1311 family)
MPRLAFIVCLLIPSFLCAQSGQNGENPAKQNPRKEWDASFAQIQQLKKSARSSYADEKARQKAGDCPQATSTYDIVTCLGSELERSTANYHAYVGAIRSTEALAGPHEGSPTGGSGAGSRTPAERVKQFDEVESAWQIFQKAQCSMAYDAYRGGTIAPVMQLTCKLRLLRDRMSELESIYQITENR